MSTAVFNREVADRLFGITILSEVVAQERIAHSEFSDRIAAEIICVRKGLAAPSEATP